MIMIAGVLFNFILALFIYSMITFTWGESYLPLKTPKPDYHLAKQLIKPDLKMEYSHKADGKELTTLSGDMIRNIAEAKNVEVIRNGKTEAITMPDEFMLKLIKGKRKIRFVRNPVTS